MKPIFNNSRVESAAAFIAAELKTLLDRYNYDSHINRRLSEGCPAYQAEELTVGEQVLATSRALSMVQLEVMADLASLTHDYFDDDDEEGEAVSIMSDQELLDRLGRRPSAGPSR
jgi:hypothetical protein